jgi:hypothetical protein
VGQSLIPHLIQQPYWKTDYYATSASQHARILASLQDHLTDSISIRRSVTDIAECDTVIFLAGGTTAQGSSKNDLLAQNTQILDIYLPYLNNKNLIMVSNPCTLLTRYAQQRLDSFVVGIGVQNDFNRIRYQHTEASYLLGAHNLTELQVFSAAGICIFDGFSSRIEYQKVKKVQDNLLKLNSNDLLLQLEQHSILRWWLTQRFHSQVNSTAHSCAHAIAQWLKVLAGRCNDIVHGEVLIKADNTPPVVIGVPIQNGNIACPAFVLEKFIQSNPGYLLNYAN